jgi:homoserine dehydrogenase
MAASYRLTPPGQDELQEILMPQPLRLGIAGLGTVGTGVVKIVQRHADMLERRTGRKIMISAVSARDAQQEPRRADLSGYAWETDPVALRVAR